MTGSATRRAALFDGAGGVFQMPGDHAQSGIDGGELVLVLGPLAGEAPEFTMDVVSAQVVSLSAFCLLTPVSFFLGGGARGVPVGWAPSQ
jgi:hypothetical protein